MVVSKVGLLECRSCDGTTGGAMFAGRLYGLDWSYRASCEVRIGPGATLRYALVCAGKRSLWNRRPSFVTGGGTISARGKLLVLACAERGGASLVYGRVLRVCISSKVRYDVGRQSEGMSAYHTTSSVSRVRRTCVRLDWGRGDRGRLALSARGSRFTCALSLGRRRRASGGGGLNDGRDSRHGTVMRCCCSCLKRRDLREERHSNSDGLRQHSWCLRRFRVLLGCLTSYARVS